MDTLTHGLLGYAVYAAAKQESWSKKERIGYASTAIIGGQIPDIEGFTTFLSPEVYLTWHRGITHSYLVSPLMALLAVGIVLLFNRSLRFRTAFGLAWISTMIHISFDWFNTWGTGIWEPFVSGRYSLGILPIVDIFILLSFAAAFLLARRFDTARVFRLFWLVIFLHVSVQGVQGTVLVSELRSQHPGLDQVSLQADFIPSRFHLVVREEDRFHYYEGSLFTGLNRIGEERDERHLVAVEEALKDGEVQALIRFLPDYGAHVMETDEDWKVTIYDPRFRINRPQLLSTEVVIPKSVVSH
ncbi:metal-dependent hydrolase [Desmospora profundinema]|uniref:Inner membrane protein n=1 Tax=Desmospora profundinema TaxID=1571184 RepID=A0ABU1IRP4_9BACL|nr:metal-dependent hydrolase [Desmospora profundinema]MDR6227464.1 inner membrane protein [Desmospora profundinema]